MSQVTNASTGGVFPPGTVVQSVTGNTGIVVIPDLSNNIDIVGAGNINTNGTPNTLTITIVGTTNHAVQVGNASGSLTSIPVGLTGQVLTGVTGGDPVFAAPAASAITITGDSGGPLGPSNAFTFTGGTTGLVFNGAGTTETLGGTLAIANGGTNATSMATTDGTVYFDGTRLVTTATGTIGQVLTSGGAGVAPAYATLPTSVAAITGGLNITITGTATNPIVSESQAQLLTNYSVANASPYVVTTTDFYITVDTSTIPITIQLPNAPTIYRRFVIKDSAGNASVQNVTVTTVGGVLNIDAAPTFVMNTNYEAMELVYDGFGYQVF